MPSVVASATCPRSNPLNAGSNSAIKISRALGPRGEIQHQNAVTVLHTAIVVNRRRFDELIRRTRFVGRFHGCDRICSPFAMGVDKQFVGPRHTVPAFVPVHCE